MLSSSSRISSVGRSTVPYVSHGRLPGFIVPSHSAALNKGVYEITGIVSQNDCQYNISLFFLSDGWEICLGIMVLGACFAVLCRRDSLKTGEVWWLITSVCFCTKMGRIQLTGGGDWIIMDLLKKILIPLKNNLVIGV